MESVSNFEPSIDESRFVATTESEKTTLEMFRDPCCLQVVSPGDSKTRPVECIQCQQLFCLSCAYDLQKKKMTCPTCRQEFNPKNANIKLIGILESLPIRCCFQSSGCNFVSKLSEIKNHEANCKYVTDELRHKFEEMKVSIPNLFQESIYFKPIISRLKCNCGALSSFEVVYDLPKRDKRFSTNSINCNMCNKMQQVSIEGVLYCCACAFTACIACVKLVAQDIDRYSCDAKHLVSFVPNVSKVDPQYMQNVFVCNFCHYFDKTGRGCWHCKVCQWDACLDCYKNPYKCDKGHYLQRTSVLPKEYTGGCFVCNYCKDTFKNSAPGVLHCRTCFYDICDQCAIITRPSLHRKCDKGHLLSLEKNLRKFPGYSSGSYICNVCKRHLAVVDIGVLHCAPCQYDLCLECAGKK